MFTEQTSGENIPKNENRGEPPHHGAYTTRNQEQDYRNPQKYIRMFNR